MVELAAGFTFRGGNPFLAGVFGDTTGLARPRGMAFDYGNGGWIAVAYIVRPSAGWKERASSTPCGFGLRAEEACSAEGPLVFRMLDSTRVLIAIRRFNADNRPVERLFLITLARPMPALHSLTMRHAFLNSQGGAVYIEDLLATQPLLLFSVSSSNALGGLRRKRDVRIVDDVIGIAQYNAVRLTLEQIERLQPAKSCRGPRGSCYEVGGVRIEFPG